VIPITGTTQAAHLEESVGAGSVKIDADLVSRLDAIINQTTVVGARYNAATQAEIDTEVFP
jgi:hypothetical protein